MMGLWLMWTSWRPWLIWTHMGVLVWPLRMVIRGFLDSRSEKQPNPARAPLHTCIVVHVAHVALYDSMNFDLVVYIYVYIAYYIMGVFGRGRAHFLELEIGPVL